LEPIMVAQTARVALIVVFAPFLVISLVGGAGTNPLLGVALVPWLPLAGLLIISGAIATLLARLRSPNAWLMTPLFIAAIASHLGLIEGRMPDVLLIAAQVLIGSALGAHFRPEFLTRLFSLLWASCVAVLFAAGTKAAFAPAVAGVAGYPVPTLGVAMAPPGIAEDGLPRQGPGLEAATITRVS